MRPRSWHLPWPALAVALGIAASPAGGAAWAQAPAQPGTQPAAEPAPAKKPPKPRPEPVALGTVTFEKGSAELSPVARGVLDAVIAGLPAEEADRRRIQILAFANGEEELVSANRRMSLARALAVRQYMVDHGVAMTRIDVRALGTIRYGQGALERADIILGIAVIPAAVDRQGK